jgi:mannosyltransferase
LGKCLAVNKSLTSLDLTNNNIGAVGAEHLGNGLAVNKSLTSLKLGGNNIDAGIISQIDILLEAWNAVSTHHPDAVLAIVGSLAGRISHERAGFRRELEDYVQRIDALRAQLAHPASVRFLGEVDDPAPLYRLADVFAFPSRREGLPNAVLEAMASGTAVVATTTGASTQIVREGVTGNLVPPDDLEALIAAVELYLASPELSMARGGFGRKVVEEHHDILAEARAINRIYGELLAARGYIKDCSA